MPLLAKLFFPYYQKTWKLQYKSKEINVINATLYKDQLYKSHCISNHLIFQKFPW